MLLIKILITIFLFLSSLVFPLVLKIWGAIFYVGLFIPITLQKIWFGYWFQYTSDKKFWKNILFSFLFIIAAVVAIDIFVVMYGIIEETDYFIIPLVVNRVFFFFSIIYLWNHGRLKKQNMILSNIFRLVKIIYIFIAMLFIFWLLISYMYFIFLPIK